MILDVRGCGSCPFLDRDVMVADTIGACALEARYPVVTAGKGRHRLAAVGGSNLIPRGRTPAWCPLRKQSVTVALVKRDSK